MEMSPWRWWLRLTDVFPHVSSFITIAAGSYHLIAGTWILGLASWATQSWAWQWCGTRLASLWVGEEMQTWQLSLEPYGSASTCWHGTSPASFMLLRWRVDVALVLQAYGSVSMCWCALFSQHNGSARMCWRGIGLTSLMVSLGRAHVSSGLRAYGSTMMCWRVISLAAHFPQGHAGMALVSLALYLVRRC